MRTFIKISVLLFALSLPVCAEDMQKYLKDTNKLVEEKKYEEALNRYLWFHEHALEHDPSMYGVRLSFALSYWKELGDVYPPALAALKKTRDDKTVLITERKGGFNLFLDVKAINRVLEDDSRTIELFRKLDAEQNDLAKQCWNVAKDAIIRVKAFDLAKKYGYNPVYEFGKVKEMYDRNRTMFGDMMMEEDFKTFNENNFVEETLRLINAAILLEDKKSAGEIRAKSLEVLNDSRLRDSIPEENGKK